MDQPGYLVLSDHQKLTGAEGRGGIRTVRGRGVMFYIKGRNWIERRWKERMDKSACTVEVYAGDTIRSEFPPPLHWSKTGITSDFFDKTWALQAFMIDSDLQKLGLNFEWLKIQTLRVLRNTYLFLYIFRFFSFECYFMFFWLLLLVFFFKNN